MTSKELYAQKDTMDPESTELSNDRSIEKLSFFYVRASKLPPSDL